MADWAGPYSGDGTKQRQEHILKVGLTEFGRVEAGLGRILGKRIKDDLTFKKKKNDLTFLIQHLDL